MEADPGSEIQITVAEQVEQAVLSGWNDRLSWSSLEAAQMVSTYLPAWLSEVAITMDVDLVGELIAVSVMDLLEVSYYRSRFFSLLVDKLPVDLYIREDRLGYYSFSLVDGTGFVRGRLAYTFPVVLLSSGKVSYNFNPNTPSNLQSVPQQACVILGWAVNNFPAGQLSEQVLAAKFPAVARLVRLHAAQVVCMQSPREFFLAVFSAGPSKPVSGFFDVLPCVQPAPTMTCSSSS